MNTLADEIASAVHEEHRRWMINLQRCHIKLPYTELVKNKPFEELELQDKTYYRIIAHRLINKFMEYDAEVVRMCGHYDPDSDKKVGTPVIIGDKVTKEGDEAAGYFM